jgi:hypothetical protein
LVYKYNGEFRLFVLIPVSSCFFNRLAGGKDNNKKRRRMILDLVWIVTRAQA